MHGSSRPTPLKLLVWNIEWATPRSRRGLAIREIVAELQPDLICLTEGVCEMLPAFGHAIDASADYGYGDTGNRRKVLLWSREPWRDLDRQGEASMPGGRFVAGTTVGIRVVGVCIPWRDAHVRTGRSDRKPWEDHMAYLGGLGQLLGAATGPVVVVGDFNQRLPRKGQPAPVYDALSDALRPSLNVITEGALDSGGKPLIDHAATSPHVTGRLVRTIPRVNEDGLRLSDHVALILEIRPTPPTADPEAS